MWLWPSMCALLEMCLGLQTIVAYNDTLHNLMELVGCLGKAVGQCQLSMFMLCKSNTGRLGVADCNFRMFLNLIYITY